MRPLTYLSPLLAATLLSGCAAICSLCQPEPVKAVAGTTAACAMAGTTERSCFKQGNKNICHVYVWEIGGVTHVYPSILDVDRSERDTVIVWHLAVQGAGFRRDDGDGPKWKAGGSTRPDQFEEGGPTDDPLGEHKNQAGATKYRIKFKNTASGGAGPHHYAIQYTVGGQRKSCDPQIISQAG